MTDTERLDAIGKHGLCLTTIDILECGQWKRTWVCQYGPMNERAVTSPDIRQAIDGAVLDLTALKHQKH